MSRLPVGPLSASSVADIVEELEARVLRATTLLELAPGAYGVEAAVLKSVLSLLEEHVRRPLEA